MAGGGTGVCFTLSCACFAYNGCGLLAGAVWLGVEAGELGRSKGSPNLPLPVEDELEAESVLSVEFDDWVHPLSQFAGNSGLGNNKRSPE